MSISAAGRAVGICRRLRAFLTAGVHRLLHKRRTAGLLWPRYSWAVDSINSNAKLKKWHADYLKGPHFATRSEMHQYVRDQIGEPIDYLEFGVYEGKSIQMWVDMATDPRSRFVGFDTFTGLPEKWELGVHSMAQGAFAVEGAPRIDDSRVRFVKGLFQDTLREFLASYERNQRLVVHCDADLYSSTLFVLSVLAAHLRAGDIIIFDEFSQPLHEYRALIDWAQAFRINYRGVASSEDYHRQVAIEIVA